MPIFDFDPADHELSLTSSEIYRAADEGVLPRADAERLVQWGFEQRFNQSSGAAEPLLVQRLVKRLRVVAHNPVFNDLIRRPQMNDLLRVVEPFKLYRSKPGF